MFAIRGTWLFLKLLQLTRVIVLVHCQSRWSMLTAWTIVNVRSRDLVTGTQTWRGEVCLSSWVLRLSDSNSMSNRALTCVLRKPSARWWITSSVMRWQPFDLLAKLNVFCQGISYSITLEALLQIPNCTTNLDNKDRTTKVGGTKGGQVVRHVNMYPHVSLCPEYQSKKGIILSI